MYVIRQQRGKEVVWLVSPNPERWGEQDRAMRFETRGDARRVALAIAVWGDWSINAAGAAPPHVRSWFWILLVVYIRLGFRPAADRRSACAPPAFPLYA
jgi:hypothetical protein